MKIGIFSTATRPEIRGDNFKDAIKCYEDLADEVVVVRGEDTWPKEFNWPLIGEHFQHGYEQLNTDWVFHFDLDMLLHEKDMDALRKACIEHANEPAFTMLKRQFILPDRFNLKSRLVVAVNKKKFGDRIKFNSGGDLCQPSLDGEYLVPGTIPNVRIPFYNYEKLSKTVNQVMDDVGRMDRAYYRHFKKYLYSHDGTDESAFNGWIKMVRGRLTKPHEFIKLEDHPVYIQETIYNLKKSQFGHSGFGLLEENKYAQDLDHSR